MWVDSSSAHLIQIGWTVHPKNEKLKIYKTITLPVVLCVGEAWPLSRLRTGC
jgi:hypothetical protein